MGDSNDCKNCIQIENIKDILTEIKVIQQEHEKRMTKLERHEDASEEKFKTLFNEINSLKDTLNNLIVKLEIIAQKPSEKLESRWEKFIEALIAVAAGALFMYFFKK